MIGQHGRANRPIFGEPIAVQFVLRHRYSSFRAESKAATGLCTYLMASKNCVTRMQKMGRFLISCEERDNYLTSLTIVICARLKIPKR
jgi:hypothetical protein